MHVGKPLTAVLPGVGGDVLSVLARSNQPRTGREIARLAGRSKSGVQAVLDRLVAHGLVDYQKAGEAGLYTLNRDHVLGPAVERLVWARSELFERLRETLRSWQVQPVHASVFGSAARGDGDISSDIDLLIVRAAEIDEEDPVWSRQTHDLAESVYRWTGNHAGIADISVGDLEELRRTRPPVIDDVERDEVELAGMPIRKLMVEG